MDRIGFDQDYGGPEFGPEYGDDEPGFEMPPVVGSDERRMQVRAYNYWASLLVGREFPSITDLDPGSLGDFGPHSVLLDFTHDSLDPALAFVGDRLRAECGLDRQMRAVSDVPPQSLLSRLTDHFNQIIANRAPIGFEAEFANGSDQETLYRGILMPFSSNGDTIDFVYGVINWKVAAEETLVLELERAIEPMALAEKSAAEPSAAAWADSPIWADAPGAALMPDDSALALADRLATAREAAREFRLADGRSHAALYAALSDAHDFGLAALEDPQTYALLLDDAGIVAQARAPMTAVAKLVFGADADKARLTEYAAALDHARTLGVARGSFTAWIEGFDGGLKGVVKAKRAAKPALKPASGALAIRESLRTHAAAAHIDIALPDDAGEFVLLVARREDGGRLAVLAPVTGEALIDKAIASLG